MIVFQIDNYLHGYYYTWNRFFWLKWVVFEGIYLFFAAVFSGVLRIQNNLLKQKYQKNQKLAELKLRSIRNQIDPHFTFNAVKLSRFLDEEIDLTRKYLEIEKFRFREKFNFQINLGEDIDFRNEAQRMIVQSFAESSINYGLVHRQGDGLLLD